MSWGWTSDTVNAHVDVKWKTLEMKVRSFRKVQGRKRCPDLRKRWLYVSQQCDQSEQQDRERGNLDAQFSVSPANIKIGTEQIWINPVTSKIGIQPLEPDTDTQLHEESVISVRKASKICISSSTRKMSQVAEDILETSCRCDVEEFQEEMTVVQKPLWSHNTSAKVSTDGPDDDSQQGPEHTEARKTPTSLKTNVLSGNKCRHALVILHLQVIALAAEQRLEVK